MSTSKFPLGLLIAVVMAAGVVGLFWSHTSAEETGLIHLAQGWNLVGWTGEKQSVSEALAPNRVYGLPDTVLAVYGYNNESQSFTRHIFGRPEISTLTDFEPEQAYWVLSKARTTWWVPNRASCPACPPACPAVTPCPDCPSPEPADSLLAEYQLQEECTGVKLYIELGERGGTDTPTEQQWFNQYCQGVVLLEGSWLGYACATAGLAWGIAISLGDADAIGQAATLVERYCTP